MQQQYQQPAAVQPGNHGAAQAAAITPQHLQMTGTALAAADDGNTQLRVQPSALDPAAGQAAPAAGPTAAVATQLQEQLQQERQQRQQEQQLLLDQQKMVAQLQQQVQELLLQQTSVASEHRSQLQRAQAAAAAELEQAQQVNTCAKWWGTDKVH